ncbi:hypothetical protein [Halobaculum limi]|uniref:hypothetical protein n=1 Tax=Halobaculum limi TaxID=3031916 RepID=UPI002405B40E|nr:hypothetical protein [Halobaculum sp. YSMS11]
MADGGGADRPVVITSGERSLTERFGSADGWVQAGLLMAAFLVLFFSALVVISYV